MSHGRLALHVVIFSPRRQSSRQRHLNWIKNEHPDQLSRSSFFFPLRLLRHGLSVFHSLTHSAFSLLAPPSSCTSAGVSCFALLLPHGAAHADPRREGGGEEPNAHLLPKIVYDRRRLLSGADADGDVETAPTFAEMPFMRDRWPQRSD